MPVTYISAPSTNKDAAPRAMGTKFEDVEFFAGDCARRLPVAVTATGVAAASKGGGGVALAALGIGVAVRIVGGVGVSVDVVRDAVLPED